MYFFDKLMNLVTGLGTLQNNETGNQFVFTPIPSNELVAAYRGDWIAGKVVDIPAEDATREGRIWSADKEQITLLEEQEKKFDLMGKLRDGMIKKRLLGGGALVMGVRGTGEWKEELILDRVKKDSLEYIHVVDRYEITSNERIRDLNSPYYGEPSSYTFSGGGLSEQIHPSRVVRLVGRKVPMRSLDTDGWGDSVLEMLDVAIKNAALSAESIAQLISKASQDIFKIPDFMDQVGTEEYRARLMERFALMQVTRSSNNLVIMDALEDWETREVNFSGLPDVIRVYLSIAAGAADIPATRLLGQAPTGLNATGDSDIRNYYDKIGAMQRNDISPALTRLDEVIIRAALGSRPPEIFYSWKPLWQPTESEAADVTLKKSQATANIVNTGIVPVEVMREPVQNMMIESGIFPGMETAINDFDNAELDETDPEVQSQFALATGAPTGEGAAKPQDMGLNGTQISSLQSIIEAVANEELPPETGKALIAVSFPAIDETQINNMIDPLKNFEPKKEEPPMIAGGLNPNAPEKTSPPGSNVVNINKAKQDIMKDGIPKSLYVSRAVSNASAITKWAKAQGIANIVPDLHVTITYSRAAVDWMKMGESWASELKIAAGGPRDMIILGRDGALVLLFACNELDWRHARMIEEGASWDHTEYQPHITISYDPGKKPSEVEPYTGEIVLGPEIFETIDDSK